MKTEPVFVLPVNFPAPPVPTIPNVSPAVSPSVEYTTPLPNSVTVKMENTMTFSNKPVNPVPMTV